MNVVYSRILKLEIGRFFKSVHLQMFLPMVLAGIASVVQQHFVPVHSWFSFLYSGVFFSGLFILLMWLIAMNKEEKKLVSGIVSNATKLIKNR